MTPGMKQKQSLFKRASMGIGKLFLRSAGLTGGEMAIWLNEVNGQRTPKDRPKHPYSQIAVVHACVNRKAKCLASMPFMLSTYDDRIIDSGPLFNLVKRPNPRMSGRDFWIASSTWLDLTGVVHWVFTKVDRDGRPMEIVPVGGWQMKAITDKRGNLVEWKYCPAGSSWRDAITLPLEQVWTVGEDSFDPARPHGYTSPLEAAGIAIAQVFKADLANEAILDNDVSPSGNLEIPQKPDDKQLADLRRELNEKYSGSRNRRRAMVLYGGMKWVPSTLSLSDMEFSTLMRMKINDICAALGVDAAAIGYNEDSNYGYAEAAKSSMWIDTIIPLGEWLADEFAAGVMAKYENEPLSQNGGKRARRILSIAQMNGSGYYKARSQAEGDRIQLAWFDDSRVHAIRATKLKMMQEASVAVTTLLAPPADVIRSYDQPLPIHPHQEVAWQSATQMPVDMSADVPGENDPNMDLPAEPAPSEESPKEDDVSKHIPDAIERAKQERLLQGLWNAWRASFAALLPKFRGPYVRHMLQLRDEMLANLKRVSNEQISTLYPQRIVGYEWDDHDGRRHVQRVLISDHHRDLISEIMFDVTAANERFIIKARPLVRTAFILGGKQTMADIADALSQDKPQAFDLAEPVAAAKLRQRTQSLAGITARTAKRLRATLAQGISTGENIDQLAERIRTGFSLETGRARTIAFQEISTSVEAARNVARDQAGAPMKSWLWSRKEKGRTLHAATESDTIENPVPANGLFVIHGTSITCPHPRATGVAEQDINCGCTTITRWPGDSIKTVAERLTRRGFLSVQHLTQKDLKNED